MVLEREKRATSVGSTCEAVSAMEKNQTRKGDGKAGAARRAGRRDSFQ